MSINEMIMRLGTFNLPIVGIFLFIPLLALITGKIVPREQGERSPFKYVYSILVFLSCVPGMFSSVLTVYTLFILRSNLLSVNIILYFLPIVSMIATVAILDRRVDLDKVPGFERLLGLFITLGVTFVIMFIILQTRIWVFFGGSMTALLIFIAILFLLLNWGAGKAFRSKGNKL